MASIYLIRHGQASWGKPEYDQLSTLGCEQSVILGRHWQNMVKPDLYYSGGMIRHGKTAEHFFNGLEQYQSITSHLGFNEFDHMDVLSCYQPDWIDQRKFNQFLKLQKNPNKAFIVEFTQALKRWFSGDFSDYKESFVVFKQRCSKALEDVIKQVHLQQDATGKSAENIMIFTSGGVIASICAHVLGIGDKEMMSLNQQLVNTSVTKLLFNKDKVTLDSVNNYSHVELAGSKFITRK
ncbi:histidine phosphatase family protein [Colwellia demingiae]|uniref:Histidine phosphatase family protein n=1 Tax=Colwellia demingiae TaxID=89401 RepID=A0A5C6QH88_9GAMM|nr:histidine phosphatase family protein [Colwellia demingiae]TWX68088.1 histidine phosphatase family protein [Colwellia demingiae]